MSTKSDIELISIQTVESYAARGNLTPKEVIHLFQKYQIFEKIALQHEYLHQISFEEIMEYIDRLLVDENKELVVFHGTTADFNTIQLSKSHNRRDFGIGFYTTLLEQQAKEWAYRLSLRNKSDRYFIYQFLFKENNCLKVKKFETLNKEWLEFIKENRSKGGLQHTFDVVIGPVADDNTMETVQLYIAGILTENEAIERLKYSKINNQISFHTEKALQYLKLVEKQEVTSI